MTDTESLCQEASEIIRNINDSDLPEDEKDELIDNVLLDVGYQLEIIPQPRSETT
jgi:hypothetical protein